MPVERWSDYKKVRGLPYVEQIASPCFWGGICSWPVFTLYRFNRWRIARAKRPMRASPRMLWSVLITSPHNPTGSKLLGLSRVMPKMHPKARTINGKEFVKDVRSGMTDLEMSERYGLTVHDFDRVLEYL